MEYGELYKKLLPELDLILWLLKADDRAYTSDQYFYNNIIKPHLNVDSKPFFFVLNQVDKIEPFREWDTGQHKPSIKQRDNIELKKNEVVRIFNIVKSKVIPISADEKYNLIDLVDEIMHSLPVNKVAPVAKQINKEYMSKKTADYVKKSSAEYIIGAAGTGAAIGGQLAGPIGAIVGASVGAFIGWGASKCYISTAVMLSLGKNDNCFELQLLRKYRDTWLIKQEYGIKLIEEYYSTAPVIVNRIDNLIDSKEIYSQIWIQYLSKIVDYIINEKNEEACEMYQLMVNKINSFM